MKSDDLILTEKLTPKNIIRAGREHAIYLDAQIPKVVIRLKPHKECFDKILKNIFFFVRCRGRDDILIHCTLMLNRASCRSIVLWPIWIEAIIEVIAVEE